MSFPEGDPRRGDALTLLPGWIFPGATAPSHPKNESVMYRFVPSTCPGCAEPVPRAAAMRCPACHHPLNTLPPRTRLACRRCGGTLDRPAHATICQACRKERPSRLAREGAS